MTRPLSWPAALLRHALLMFGAAIMLAPFVWMVSTSFKPPTEIFTTDIRLLPRDWRIYENYKAAFERAPLLRYLLNGFLVTGAIFVAQTLVAVPCAYALAKLRFRGRETLFVFVLFALLIPPQVPAIPVYIMLYWVGALDTYAALILPSTISVFGVFLMRQFFRTIPDELLDAARLDGLNEFAIVWRIVLPSAIPALLAFGIFSFVWNWNDYFWPSIAIRSPELMTPPMGVVALSNQESGTDLGPFMAGATAITAPLAIAFLLAQRRFVEGLTLTGVKG